MTETPNQIHNLDMARQARIIVPNTPHHVTQRGNRGDFLFFEKADYQTYLDIVNQQCLSANLKLYSYCLLPNQIHLLIEPSDEHSLAKVIGEAHRRYTVYMNTKKNWTGHLFQNRFFSYACDEPMALRAARFIETLPITMKITQDPEKYLWSSAKSRIKAYAPNPYITAFKFFSTIQDWQQFLSRPMDPLEMNQTQLHLQTGRPRGSNLFLDMIEKNLGRSVRPQKRGRKPAKQAKAA